MSLKTGYKKIRIPIEQVENIKMYIDGHKDERCRTVPELIREAIREHLEEKKATYHSKTS